MKPLFRFIATVLISFSFLIGISSCEKPKSNTPMEKAPDRTKFNELIGKAPDSETGAAKPGTSSEKAPLPEPPLEKPPLSKEDLEIMAARKELDNPDPVPPQLQAAIRGDVITLKAKIKSRFHRESIIETMKNAFPNHTLNTDIVASSDYIAVGWTNRFANGFLIEFFQMVPDGTVELIDGTLTLQGTTKSENFRHLQETASSIFAGPYTKAVDNQIIDGVNNKKIDRLELRR